MSDPIVATTEPVTLLGGAKTVPSDVEIALTRAPTLVAIDGGADTALTLGRDPEAVVGDMDSLSVAARAAFSDRLHPIEEQQTTDFDKALRSVAAPLMLAVGVTGGRFDHELAVMSVLVAHPDRPCIVLGAETIVCLCPARITLDLAPGTDVSLFPLAPCRVGSTGLRWPTDGLDFAPDGRIGTSNAATGPVTLEPEAPKMLLILPRTTLDGLIAAMVAARGWA